MPFQILLFLLYTGLSFWIFQDSLKRRFSLISSILWAISAFFLPIVIIPLFFIFRSRNASTHFRSPPTTLPHTKLCPKCGHDNPPNRSTCASCQNTLDLTSV